MKTSTLRNAISIALLAVVAGTGTSPALAQGATAGPITPSQTSTIGEQTKVDFDLPAGTLAAALDALGAQSGMQVDYPPALVANKRVKAIHGHMSWREALDRLLQGSGLAYRQASDTTVVITRPQASARTGSHGASTRQATTASPSASKVTELSTLTVTGTRIRGGTTASPVITIGSEQIQAEGFTDLGQVIRHIPQNFSGGQNPGVARGPNVGVNNYNVTGGSALNLRGLGADATLTLLNGHRMAYGGSFQTVDISAIPVEAVDRIEIVPDGASAIYGSDAVGGVANVILKRDFNGVTVGARYGGATEGGLITREYTATAGTTWSTGGLIATWKKSSNDPIYADQRDYTRSMYQPSTLWQGNHLRSGLVSLHQSVGESVELHLDALRNERNILTVEVYSPSIYYPDMPKTTATLVAPSLDLRLPNDWVLSLSVALGKNKTIEYEQEVNSDTGIASPKNYLYNNKSLAYELGAEGRLFTLPGGDAKLAVGVGYRHNDFLYRLSDNTVAADGGESSRFAYAELNLPLVGPEQGIGGVERFELTGAARTQDGTYGRVTTPKFGLIYSPDTDFTLKASWGKSFKEPTLYQRYWTPSSYLYSPTVFGGVTRYPADATVIWRSGGNADLRPERARTWSASLSFHPEALPGLESELTWFDIDYADRIVAPIVVAEALTNPAYAGLFVHYQPSDAVQAEALAHSRDFYNYIGGTPYDPSKVVAIVDDRYANTVRQRIKGIDLSGSYLFDLGAGQLTVRGSASWLDSKQILVAGESASDLSGTLFYPAKLNSRIGAVWRQGGFTASLFGNYKSGVTDISNGRKGASFTTVDAALRYDTGERDDAWSNLALELSAQNLLNRAPPLYAATSLSFTPYDSTNYSAVGRFLSLSLSKHW